MSHSKPQNRPLRKTPARNISLRNYVTKQKSNNGKYTVAWRDSDGRGRGGHRYEGDGSYAVFGDGSFLYEGKVQRPNDGKISNNGSFILNDWMFGDDLNGTFYGFNSSGKVIIKHLFYANLFNNGISQNGNYAVCQTANNKNEDGGVLAFFDLKEGSLKWKQRPESGWADLYEFDDENRVLNLVYKGLGKFKYDFDGNFLDQKRYENARIKKAKGYELALIAIDQFKIWKNSNSIPQNESKKLIKMLDRSLQEMKDDSEKSLAFRYIGEIFEENGDLKKASEFYKSAIKMNPKVGVKRKLDKLIKEGL